MNPNEPAECAATAPSEGLGISGELNIYTAGEWRDKLSAAFARPGDIQLDLAEVSEIDTAGLQLLIAAKVQARREGRELALVRHSPPVLSAFEFCRLESLFGDPLLLGAEQHAGSRP